MAQTGYEVLVPELTVHKQVGELTDPQSGEVTGIQQGQGKTYIKGDLIPESAVSPILLEALDDENHPSHEYVTKRLKKTTRSATGQEVRVPFAGYDDMDEDQIVALLPNLPSATVTQLREYEATQKEPREAIVGFNIGYGESAIARQEGKVHGGLDEEGRDNANKRVAELRTREVPEDGPVVPGEGITGTGDPQQAHFADADSDDKPKGARARRGRRQRSDAEGQSGSSGGDGGGGES